MHSRSVKAGSGSQWGSRVSTLLRLPLRREAVVFCVLGFDGVEQGFTRLKAAGMVQLGSSFGGEFGRRGAPVAIESVHSRVPPSSFGGETTEGVQDDDDSGGVAA